MARTAQSQQQKIASALVRAREVKTWMDDHEDRTPDRNSSDAEEKRVYTMLHNLKSYQKKLGPQFAASLAEILGASVVENGNLRKLQGRLNKIQELNDWAADNGHLPRQGRGGLEGTLAILVHDARMEYKLGTLSAEQERLLARVPHWKWVGQVYREQTAGLSKAEQNLVRSHAKRDAANKERVARLHTTLSDLSTPGGNGIKNLLFRLAVKCKIDICL